MDLFISVLPLILIIVLLLLRQHMLVAGLAGGVLAAILGGFGPAVISEQLLSGVSQMLGITVPILYAATAAMVAKSGAIRAIIDLAKRYVGGRIAILAAALVLIQAIATYMAGLGAGNTMVIAPLVAIAVGAIPEVIAGMAIVTAIGFTTSPASSETALTAEMAEIDVVTHASNMQPYLLLFVLVGMGVAAWGAHRRGALSNSDGSGDTEESSWTESLSNAQLWKYAIPAAGLLLMVVAGGAFNDLIGFPLFVPGTIVIFTALLNLIFTGSSMKDTADNLVNGAQFILVALFSVGIFLGFVNLMGELGTFANLAEIAGYVPPAFVLPVAMIIGFIVAFPAGAFTVAVLALILPTLAALGLSSVAMGFVAMAVGLGTQLSPVQINVVALSEGFSISVTDVIRKNLKVIPFVFLAMIIIAVIFV